MNKQTNLALPAALLLGLSVTLAGCDAVEITGPGSLDIGQAQSGNLFSDGDFEQGANTWQMCSTTGSSELTSDASSGTMALQLSNSACRSQVSAADAGANYQLTCDAKATAGGWSAVSLAFLDQNLQPLGSQEVAVSSATYTAIDITLSAPASTTQTEVLFYSEGSMTVDNCALTQI